LLPAVHERAIIAVQPQQERGIIAIQPQAVLCDGSVKPA
jgi:hypothetical protein